MRRIIRILLGIGLVGIVLHLADLATRDCRIAPYVYDNCLWIGLRGRLSLPANPFLRMAVLECVGIMLALLLYLTFRHVFPFRRVASRPLDSTRPNAAEPSGK